MDEDPKIDWAELGQVALAVVALGCAVVLIIWLIALCQIHF
jgi:hypothetical protein